jgi:hypothetical protein
MKGYFKVFSRHVNFDFGNSSKNPDELLLLDK